MMIKHIVTSTMFMIMLLSGQASLASEINTQLGAVSFAHQAARFRQQVYDALRGPNPVEEIERLCRENPNTRAMIASTDAIHCAAERGNVGALEVLLRNGAKLDARNNNDEQPIHYAAYGGNVEVVEALLGAGAEVEARNYRSEQPIHLAADSANVDALRVLLRHGASLRVLNWIGRTPVHQLCSWNNARKAGRVRAALRVLHAASDDDSMI